MVMMSPEARMIETRGLGCTRWRQDRCRLGERLAQAPGGRRRTPCLRPEPEHGGFASRPRPGWSRE